MRSFVLELWRNLVNLVALIAVAGNLDSILPAIVCPAACRIGLYHKSEDSAAGPKNRASKLWQSLYIQQQLFHSRDIADTPS